ncbi:uncharacterized protein SRS1_16024 [Sporisorium reilianum f. sp. reilianum]|uniref:Uncharacterized protein n=1 Tax=Sporisorium reilianum f. sp. reilianum TaxID=72559 RepID=A0A2N8UJQ5_9BASI|nr:uncharacterized protein SRS1_16024 [Sporisorium reilianum f. sp. reilianum]
MEAALRSLGAWDAKDRVRRYVAQHEHQRFECTTHDSDCFCDHCERQQVLGLRRVRRSAPAIGRASAGVGTDARLSGDERDRDGAPGPVRKQARKRPVNENARRGQSKIGRAAHLRPGRLTFPLPHAMDPFTGGQCSSTAPFERSDDMETGPARDPCVSEESSWHSDEHSQYSIRRHRQGAHENRRGQEERLYDFYARNPAAKANGWLSLPHHRYASSSRVGGGAAVKRAARAIIQSQQRQVLGLLPRLGRGRKRK